MRRPLRQLLAAVVIAAAAAGCSDVQREGRLPDIELDLNDAFRKDRQPIDVDIATEFVVLANLNLGPELIVHSAATPVTVDDYTIGDFTEWKLAVRAAIEIASEQRCAAAGAAAPCAKVEWQSELGGSTPAVGTAVLVGPAGDRKLEAESLCVVLRSAGIGCDPAGPASG